MHVRSPFGHRAKGQTIDSCRATTYGDPMSPDAADPVAPTAEFLAGKGHTMPADEQVAAYAGPIADGTDGPVVMLNLNKYRERAAYADGRDTGGRSGREV